MLKQPFAQTLQTTTRRILLSVGLAVGLSACIGLVGTSSYSATPQVWQEEVQLHDGRTIVTDRGASRSGRHEVNQQSPMQEETLEFTHPDTRERILWKSQASSDIRMADLAPIALHVIDTKPYLLTYPVGCQSYNKWRRPNPPYVLFQYTASSWQRIPMSALPPQAKTLNLIISSPDNEVERMGTRKASAAEIARVNAELTQPEYRSILREPMTNGGNSCRLEFTNGKGRWLGADWFSEEPNLASCQRVCVQKEFSGDTCPCKQFFKGE